MLAQRLRFSVVNRLEFTRKLLIPEHVPLDERDAVVRGFQFRLGDVGGVRVRIAVVARLVLVRDMVWEDEDLAQDKDIIFMKIMPRIRNKRGEKNEIPAKPLQPPRW